MVRLYLKEGMGSKQVASCLNNHGYRTREGKLWRDVRVRDVLQNPIIAGLPAYNRTRAGNTPNSRVKGENFYDLNNPDTVVPRDADGNPRPWPELQIITLEDRLKVTGLMCARRLNIRPDARSLDSPALLTGFLKCGYCSRGFISSRYTARRRRASGEVYTYPRADYRCLTHVRIGKEYCDGPASYTQKKIDDLFMAELETFLGSLDLGNLEEYIKGRQTLQLTRAQKQLKDVERELARVERRLQNWVDRLNRFLPVLSPASIPKN